MFRFVVEAGDASLLSHVYNAKPVPYLQLYKNQAKVAEHIAAEGSKDAVTKVRLVLLVFARSIRLAAYLL